MLCTGFTPLRLRVIIRIDTHQKCVGQFGYNNNTQIWNNKFFFLHQQFDEMMRNTTVPLETTATIVLYL